MENIELLRPLLAQGLFSVDSTSDISDFKSWIASGAYSVSSAPSSNVIELRVSDSRFYNMLCYDSCRFASAAFESTESIHSIDNFPRAFAWMSIKAYYAAFFAAHSIMRYFGISCSQLERGHVDQLIEYANLVFVDYHPTASRGFFKSVYDRGSNTVTIEKMGNTHEDTWLCFRNCLRASSSHVLGLNARSSNKQQLSAKLDSIVDALENNGRSPRGTFLSQFRNAVNYRQEFRSWYPYGSKLKSDKILELINQWKIDRITPPSRWKEIPEAYDFFLTCTEIVNMCRKLTYLMNENSSNIKNPFAHWPIKFLNLSKTTS